MRAVVATRDVEMHHPTAGLVSSGQSCDELGTRAHTRPRIRCQRLESDAKRWVETYMDGELVSILG
jgi:hypothetical protein